MLKLKVLDLTRVLAGPFASMVLGDLGADVIKVERPGSGDETRGWGPPFDDRGEAAYYLSVNRNKRSLEANLALPDDRALVLELMRHADVVLENFLPGRLASFGLDPLACLAANPRLIWCTITGFAATPERPGYDFVVQAEQGWMSITGEANGAPMKHGVALADVMAGKDAVISVLGALLAREQRTLSLEERHLMVTLSGSALAALVNVAQNALVSGIPSKRWGNAHANLVPYQLFEAADRSIVVAVGNDVQWTACARVLELGALVGNPRLATNAGRLANRDEVVRAIAARLRERPAAEWISRLTAAGVPAGVVRSVAEALSEAGASPLTGVPSSVGGTVRLPPPMLGEHSAAIRANGWGAFGG